MKRVLLATLISLFSGLSLYSQTYVWAEQITGSSYQIVKDADTDPSGNVYVAGWMIGNSTFDTISLTGLSYDGFIGKYNDEGSILWAQRIGSSSYDGAFQVATDANGDVVAAGWFYGSSCQIGDTSVSGSANTYDTWLAKWDSTGTLQWARSITGGGYKRPIGLAMDPDGNVAIQVAFQTTLFAGSSSFSNSNGTQTTSGYYDEALIRYDTDGNFMWKQQIESPHIYSNSWYWEYSGGVDIDANYNIYVGSTGSDTLSVGSSYQTAYGGYDAFIIKFDSSGSVSWIRNGGGTSQDYVSDLTIDNNNKIFISGRAYNSLLFGSQSATGTAWGPYVAQYNASGTAQYAVKGSGLAYLNKIDVDDEGNFYLTGLMYTNTNVSVGSVTVTNPSNSGYTPYYIKRDYSGNSWEWGIAPTVSTNWEYTGNITAHDEDHVYGVGSFLTSVTFGTTTLSGTSYDGFITKIANCDYLVAQAYATGNDTGICDGEDLDLYADTNSLYEYQWLYNGAVLAGETNPTLTVDDDGAYSIVIDSGGCVDTSNVLNIVVNALPSVTHSNFSSVCDADDPFTLTGGNPSGGTYNGTGVSGGTTFDPGSAALGNNTIWYIYSDSNGCTDSTSKTLTVNGSPAIFTTTLSACESDAAISLAGAAYGFPTGGTHSGPGVTGNSFDPGSAGAGTHAIFYASSNGCLASDSIVATVTASPSVSLDTFADVCVTATGFALSGGSPSGGTYSGLGVFGSFYYPAFAGAGTHNIIYTVSASGCSAADTSTITVDPTASSSISTLPDLCEDDDTLGLLSYGTPSGGSFSGTGVSSNIFDPASSGTGTFTLTYTFTNACGTATDTESITVNDLPALTMSSSNVSCNGLSDGSATVSATNGSPFTYAWSNSASGATASGLAAGTYTVTVTNTNGCSDTITVTITEPTAISISTSMTPTSCNGGNDGNAGAFASGGTSPYTYSWSNGSSGGIITGLTAGTYTVTVEDDNSCTETATVTVTEPSAVLASISSSTNVSCNGSSDGTATASGSGGTSPYTYSWSNSTTGATTTGLAAGTYTVTVEDDNGCTDTETVTITEPTSVTASISSSTNVSCNGGADGSATATGTGGTSPYTYSWSNSSTGATATGLAAGTYTVTVEDDNGCTDTETVTITEPSSAVAASIGTPTNVSCNGGTDGAATASGTGGTSPYTYSWSNSATGATATGLAAGTYTVTVEDDNGCTDTETVTITEPTAVTASISSSTNASCNGANDGAATASASGGTSPYTYSWSTGATTATITSLTAGTYTVTVEDDNSCTDTETVTITEPTAVTASISSSTNASCNGAADGSATASGSGGTSPYTYSWSNSSTGATATGLAAGTYTVTVEDDNGCTDTETVTITEPSSMTASISSSTNVSCNGGADGSATATGTGGTSPYTYSWSNSATGATATGLAAGTYTVTVEDDNGCTDTETVTITEPSTAVAASIGTPTNVSCNGGTDGAATASGSGGTSPYTYSWSNSATGATATGLAAGTYTVTVEDDNGCTDTETVTITEPTAVTASISSSTNASCNGANDGAATASSSGGTSPYTYSWSTGATTATITSLTAGTYTVTVEDDNSCTDTETVTITEPTAVTASISSSTNASCNGAADGSATASGSGGTSPYTYSWSNSSTGATATGLAAGTYTVTVEDDNGCTDTETVTITEPSSMTASISSSTNVSCNGGADGSATATGTGGTSPYTYSWSNSATGATATGLAVGTYTVTVEDDNGCTDTETVTITEPSTAVAASIGTPTNVSCNGGTDGAATASGSGGTSPYTYSWSNSATGATATGLAAGTYTVTVEDDNGCTDTETVTITEPTAVTASISSSTNASCNGANDGAATASASGGTSPYTYSWSTGATTATITGLTAGTYTVTVEDDNSCTDTETVTITEPTAVTASISSSTNASCNGAADGSATASGSGGTSPYTYSWSNSSTGATATGLAAGTYTVTVEDDNGCTDTETVTITEPSSMTASISSSTNVSCNGGADGSATATGTGGTSPYTYSWSNSATGATATGLAAGTYTVTVEDDNGCTDTETVTITEPSTAVAASIGTPTNVSCNGGTDGAATASGSGGTSPYTYSWSNSATGATASGLAAGTYTVTVEDDNGCTAIDSVTITEPTALIASISSSTNTSCNGACDGSATASGSGGTSPYTYAWSTGGSAASVSGLCAGTYTVTVEDDNGCTDEVSVTITEPTAVTASISSSTNTSCNGAADGSATASGSGGTSPYTYSWSNSSSGATATGLAAGTYTVTVEDGNGCTDTETVTITEPTILVASISSSTNASCFGGCDGSATATATGGTSPYTYSWSSSGSSATQTGLCAGTYTVTVEDDNGCTDIETITITEPTIMNASASVDTSASCSGSSDGVATANGSGGTSPYSYNWSNGDSTATATGLASGTHTVTVTDDNGCTDTAMVNMGTLDTVGPTLITQNITIYLDSFGTVTIGADSVDNGSFDVCGIDSMYLSQYTFTCADLGVNSESFTAEDAAGNSSSTTVSITVIDSQPPVVITNSFITVYLDNSGMVVITPDTVDSASYDNCSIQSMWLSDSVFSCADTVSTNVVTLYIQDQSGNVDSAATCEVLVIDTMAPVIFTQNITVYVNQSGFASIDTSMVNNGSYDNCAIGSMWLSDTAFSCSGLGAQTVTLYVADIIGNVDSAVATVTVVDSLAPIVNTQDTTLYLDNSGQVVVDSSMIDNGTYDNCVIDSVWIDQTLFNCSDTGINSVWLYASDSAGNIDSSMSNVTIVDSTAPMIAGNGTTIYIDGNGIAVLDTASLGLSISDNCQVDWVQLDQDTFSCADVGNYQWTAQAGDMSGNVNALELTIVVADTIAPTVNAQSITIYLDSFGMATIDSTMVNTGTYDNCSIDSMWLAQDTFNCADTSSTIMNWLYASDQFGNVDSVSFITTVVDTLAPVLSATSTTIYLDSAGLASIDTSLVTLAFDNCGIDSLYFSQNNFNCSDTGSNSITVSAVDGSGNQSNVLITVTVLDTVAPYVNSFSAMNVYVNSNGVAYLNAAMFDDGSFDNCQIDSLYISMDSLTCSSSNPTTVVLTGIDGSGNMSSDSTVVTIVDTTLNVSLTIVEDSVCQGQLVALDSVSTIGGVYAGNGISGDTLYTDTLVGWQYITYTVTNSSGCSDFAVDSVFITGDPTVTLSPDTFVLCAGETMELDFASPVGGMYVSQFADSNILTAPDTAFAGVAGYYVFSNSCGSDTGLFYLGVPEPPVVDLGPDTSLCNAYQLSFDAGSHSSYQWSTGATTQAITINDGEEPLMEDQTVWVSVTDANGCSTSDTVFVDVMDQPTFYLGDNFTICRDSAVVLSVPNVYDGFAWSDSSSGTSILAHDGSLVIPGLYTFWATGTNTGGCSYSDTIVINLKDCSPEGLEALTSVEGIDVYPNPTAAEFNVSLLNGSVDQINRIRIVDIRGREAALFNPSDWSYSTSGDYLLVNVSNLANGVYVMQVVHEDGVHSERVIIER